MSTTTTNYGLIKPDTTDPILIGQLNDNSDAIDAALKENADAIENKPDAADIPTPSTAAPAMDGTASPGTSEDYARADHVHPSDTSKQDALTTAQLAAANSGINSEKVAQYDSTTELEAEDRAALIELVDGGAKNAFIVGFTSKAATSALPSCTNNSDGTITLNGSRVGNDTIIVFDLSSNASASFDTRYTLPSGKYVVSGSTNINARIQVYCHNGTESQMLATSANNAVEFNYTSELKTNYPYIVWRLNIKGSSTFNNTKLYPMICTKAAWDISHAYQPYCPSYQELYERVVALEQANQ